MERTAASSRRTTVLVERWRRWRVVIMLTSLSLLVSILFIQIICHSHRNLGVSTLFDPPTISESSSEVIQDIAQPRPDQLLDTPAVISPETATIGQISNMDSAFESQERMADAVKIYESVLGLASPELIAGLPRDLRNVIVKSVAAVSKIQRSVATNPTAEWQVHARHSLQKSEMKQFARDRHLQPTTGQRYYLNKLSYSPSTFRLNPGNEYSRQSSIEDVTTQNVHFESSIGVMRPEKLFKKDKMPPHKKISLEFFRAHPRTDAEIFKHDLAIIILLLFAVSLVCIAVSAIRCIRNYQKRQTAQPNRAEITANSTKLGMPENPPELVPIADHVTTITNSLVQVAAELVGAETPQETAVDVAISVVRDDQSISGSDGEKANAARFELAKALRAWLRQQGFSAALCRRGLQDTSAAAKGPNTSLHEERVLRARLVLVFADNVWVRSAGCVRLLSLAVGANQLHARPSIYVLYSRDFAFRDGLAVGHFRLVPGNSSVLDVPPTTPAAWEVLRPHLPRPPPPADGIASTAAPAAGGSLSPEDVDAARAAGDEIESRISEQLRPLLEVSPRTTLLSAPGAVMAPKFLRPEIRFDHAGGGAWNGGARR